MTFIEAVLAEGRAASAEVDNVARRAALTDDFAHAVAELRRAAPARTTDTDARQARSNDEGARQAR